jgi:hypothetical protein
MLAAKMLKFIELLMMLKDQKLLLLLLQIKVRPL